VYVNSSIVSGQDNLLWRISSALSSLLVSGVSSPVAAFDNFDTFFRERSFFRFSPSVSDASSPVSVVKSTVSSRADSFFRYRSFFRSLLFPRFFFFFTPSAAAFRIESVPSVAAFRIAPVARSIDSAIVPERSFFFSSLGQSSQRLLFISSFAFRKESLPSAAVFRMTSVARSMDSAIDALFR